MSNISVGIIVFVSTLILIGLVEYSSKLVEADGFNKVNEYYGYHITTEHERTYTFKNKTGVEDYLDRTDCVLFSYTFENGCMVNITKNPFCDWDDIEDLIDYSIINEYINRTCVHTIK